MEPLALGVSFQKRIASSKYPTSSKLLQFLKPLTKASLAISSQNQRSLQDGSSNQDLLQGPEKYGYAGISLPLETLPALSSCTTSQAPPATQSGLDFTALFTVFLVKT
mmetsp:Transcript_35382/g.72113  ORF Transcript_35382/g.72113 Transcript_35382/m.72113 type:complete len:108 (-) Transcript_35382:105-428(-)